MAGRAARAFMTTPSIHPRCSRSASEAGHFNPHAQGSACSATTGPVSTVLFDIGAWVTKRESLKAAAVWTLWAGVIGGWVAVLAGLQAEQAIEHGEAIHELMETHETLALTTMGIFTVVLGWKLYRRAKLTSAEEVGLRVLSLAGLVTIVWTGVLGGKLMFEHAAGIPKAMMQAEMENREAGHHHEEGEAEEHEHADSTKAAADSAKAPGHTHAPGTPPHKH